MSGEVPTRKRKDRKKRKANLEQLQKEEYLDERTRINLPPDDDDDDIVFRPSRANLDETLLLNSSEENRGSGWCSKLVFLILIGSIGLAIGVVFLEIDANQQLSNIVADSATKVSSFLQDTSETVTSLWSEHGESASEIYETVKKTIGLEGEPEEDKVPLEDLEEPKPSEESKEAVEQDEEFFDEGGEMFEEEEEESGLPIETPEGNVIPEPVQPGDVYEEVQTNQESREESIPEVEGDAPDDVVSTPVESPDEAQSIPQDASNLENSAKEEEAVPEIIGDAPQDFVSSPVDEPDKAQSLPQEEADISEIPKGMHEDAVSTPINKEEDQRFEDQTLNAAEGVVEGIVSTPVDSPLEAQSIPEEVLEQHNAAEEFVEMAENSESREVPIDSKELEQSEEEIVEDFISNAAQSPDEAQSIPEEVVQTHSVQEEFVEASNQPNQKEAEEREAPDNIVSTAADSPQEAQSIPEEVLLQDTHSVVDEIIEAVAGDNSDDEKFEVPEVKYNAPDDMVSAPANPDPEMVQTVPKPEATHTNELYPDSYGQKKEMPALSETPDEEEDEDGDEDISAERASYSKSSITSNLDWEIRDELDDAEDTISKSALEALTKFEEIIRAHPNSPRALYGRALALEKLSEKERSNSRLEQAIFAYRNVIDLEREVPDELYRLAGTRCVDRMKFRGFQGKAIRTQQRLILRFPEDLSLRNELAVIYMTVGQNDAAKELLEDTMKTWPDSGFAKAHYGFILKNIHHDIKEGARYMGEGIDSGEEGIDGRFYYHLGDAYERLGRRSDAEKIYEEGARRGYFRSKDQRSLYNVDRLESKPFWTKEETTYETFLNKLEANWEIIRDEGLSLMNLTPPEGFKDESESLRDTGDWKQFELYARGRKLPGCSKAPKTCALIGSFEPASSCKRGQAKFSVMHPGTHVWAHTGPTNCRLRSHLGLKVSEGMVIRVVNETRTWEEGKIFVFDDSFDHEVWHNGTEFRLVLIVDLWHPDLTENERQTLPAI